MLLKALKDHSFFYKKNIAALSPIKNRLSEQMDGEKKQMEEALLRNSNLHSLVFKSSI